MKIALGKFTQSACPSCLQEGAASKLPPVAEILAYA